VTEPDDNTLLAQWREGDAAAGQALFRRHFDSVYGFFETKCANEADELVQSTFLACVKARDQFRGESSFRAYLFTIARHQLYRMYSNRQRTNALIDFNASSVAELVSTPGTKLARNEEHRRLIETLQRLPCEQQMILELHYWQELGIEELAHVLEANAATVRQRLHRARKALYKELERFAPKEATGSLEGMDGWVRGFV
jgi:RNA polymerase sigma factor (sigma-70 family)